MNALMKTVFITAAMTASAVTAIGNCEGDCAVDSDCNEGLWCADAHKAELKARGFDGRKANCGLGEREDKYKELCFDPKILKKSGGAGGGK